LQISPGAPVQSSIAHQNMDNTIFMRLKRIWLWDRS
jgi:hypothetical protein